MSIKFMILVGKCVLFHLLTLVWSLPLLCEGAGTRLIYTMVFVGQKIEIIS